MVEKNKRNTEQTEFETVNALMNFFTSKKAIAEHANFIIRSKIDEDEIHYSSFTRALEFEPVVPFIIEILEELASKVQTSPREFLPEEPSGTEFEIRTWMREWAPAPWWFEALKLEHHDIAPNSFQVWMSSGNMKRAKIDLVMLRVTDWWERLERVIEKAEYCTWARDRFLMGRRQLARYSKPFSPESEDTYFRKRLVDDPEPMSVDDARDEFVRIRRAQFTTWEGINTQFPEQTSFVVTEDRIDLNASQFRWDARRRSMLRESKWTDLMEADYQDHFIGGAPDDVLVHVFAFNEERARKEFDQMVDDDFPFSKSTLRPDDFEDHEEWGEVKRWGGRRVEQSLDEPNRALWLLYYRDLDAITWDDEYGRPKSTRIRREVSHDGETWRAANEREQRGWIVVTPQRFKQKENPWAPMNVWEKERSEVQRNISSAEDAMSRLLPHDPKCDELRTKINVNETRLERLMREPGKFEGIGWD